MTFDSRHRRIFHRLWTGAPTNRLDLAHMIGLTPNAAGALVNQMIHAGLLHECTPSTRGRGRPTIPVEIDPARRQVLGMALYSGHIEIASLNLRGQLMEPAQLLEVPKPSQLLRTAQRSLSKSLTPNHLAIGLSVTGFMDIRQQRLLLSSALAGLPDGDLAPLFASVGKIPLYPQNDMHAMAARWLLTQPENINEDVLLVLLADSQVGATILIGGKPNSGCVAGGNELGHMRLPVATDRCYCGQTGCLERIFSSEFARARLGLVGALPDMIRQYDGRPGPLAQLIHLTSTGLANVTNFLRPHRLVLISPYTRYPVFANELLRQTRELLLRVLADRVRIDLWEQPASGPAETAAYLPLAAMCLDGWTN